MTKNEIKKMWNLKDTKTIDAIRKIYKNFTANGAGVELKELIDVEFDGKVFTATQTWWPIYNCGYFQTRRITIDIEKFISSPTPFSNIMTTMWKREEIK